MQMTFLPELDRKKTQKAVEDALEKYRLYKYLEYEEIEASVIGSYTERFHSNTNKTSDQTSAIAIRNVDIPNARRAYCERVERVVNRLPRLEKFLITERYMGNDSEYITDYQVYCFQFQPPISEGKYSKIRWKAFYKIALALDIVVLKSE